MNKNFYKAAVLVFALCLLPLEGNAIFGIQARREQKELLAKARAAYDAGRYTEAINTANELLLKDAPKRRIRRAYLVLGRSYDAMGDYEKALLTYNEAMEFYPKDLDISLGLADIYYKGGLTDKAIEVYNTALALHPENMDARLGLARSYYKEGFFTRSSKYYKEYIDELKPQDPQIYKEYALSQYAANHYDNALKLIMQAKEMQGAKESYDTDMVIAKIYRAKGDNAAAMKAMEEAYRHAPDNKEVALTYAMWLADEGKTAAAIKIANGFLQHKSSIRLALFVKFMAYYEDKNYDEAHKMVQQLADMEGEGFIDRLAQKLAKEDLKKMSIKRQ